LGLALTARAELDNQRGFNADGIWIGWKEMRDK
jgi:hypothetical protein